ncbi:MAG: Response regulator of zinc sigma-54-dependent two-component system [Nitrospira sp.]|jgi:DNA-binding NtrC family response regulator|nr:Response regulator of zinc sigma-54-dependent two-component system [Nitrospira sp.]
MRTPPSILVVDDDQQNRDMLAEALSDVGFEVDIACDGAEALSKATTVSYDAVLSDIRMAPLSGLDLLDFLRKTMPEMPVVLLTAFGSVDTAIQAMKQGAYNYITKPVNLDELVFTITHAIEYRRLIEDNRTLHRAFSERPQAASLIGQSKKMVEVFKLVGRVSRGRTAVLIQGESGTGKELIARAIHDNSPRATHRFVAVNCSAIPDSLLESEFFGHIKGSFTGAHILRRGLLEEASGGTFFLDEVGDLSSAGQAKLLRVLQEGEIRRIGSNESIRVDVRVIAASRRNLAELVAAGRFREDLLYRLNTVMILLPPLRERPEDIPLLADFFLARYGDQKEIPVTSFSSAAMRALAGYAWPGNVRELEHVVERAVALAPHAILSNDDLPPEVLQSDGNGADRVEILPGTLKALQREQVLKMLESAQGNKERTARLLGISRRTLYRLLDRYGLGKPRLSTEPDASDSTGFDSEANHP